MKKSVNISEFVGKTLKAVDTSDDMVTFYFDDNSAYQMYHEQDCCETVSLEKNSQEELKHLIGETILVAHETTNEGRSAYGSYTWTFYTIISQRATATLRWYGESNGYYSESVSIYQSASQNDEEIRELKAKIEQEEKVLSGIRNAISVLQTEFEQRLVNLDAMLEKLDEALGD